MAVKIIAFTHQLNTSILHFPSFKIPFHCRPNKNGTRLKSISLENRIISFFTRTAYKIVKFQDFFHRIVEKDSLTRGRGPLSPLGRAG